NRAKAPGAKKPLTQQQLSTLVNQEFAKFPGLDKVIVQDLSLSGFTASRGFPVEFTIRGPEWEDLAKISDDVQKKMKDYGLMTAIDSDYRVGQPEIHVIPNRDKAASRGINIRTIGESVNAMIGGTR